MIVIATDGYVDVERDAFTLIREHLDDANVFTFGIGSSVNRHLIEGMARVGEGTPFVVLKPDEARGAAARFLSGFTGQGRSKRRVKVSRDFVSPGNDVIKYLWARAGSAEWRSWIENAGRMERSSSAACRPRSRTRWSFRGRPGGMW